MTDAPKRGNSVANLATFIRSQGHLPSEEILLSSISTMTIEGCDGNGLRWWRTSVSYVVFSSLMIHFLKKGGWKYMTAATENTISREKRMVKCFSFIIFSLRKNFILA